MYHQHIIEHLHNRELNELYISSAIRTFAIAMINLFVAIYLFKLGFSFTSILLFYLTYYVIHIICIFPVSHIIARIGIKHTILLSVPPLILYYLTLYTLPQFHWPLLLPAMFVGIAKALFWTSYHLDFARFSNKKERGTQVGIMQTVNTVFRALGPIIGAIILTLLGFKALFATVVVLLFVSTIPLFYSKDTHEHEPVSYKKIFNKRKFADTISFLGFGIEGGLLFVIWPLFIFLNISSKYTTIGLATSISLLLTVVSLFFVSAFSNKRPRSALRLGSIAHALIWGVRGLIKTSGQLFFIESLFGLLRPLVSVPFNVLCYNKANQQDRVEYILYREFCINLGTVLFFTVLLLMSLTLHDALFIGAPSMLLFFLY